MDLTVQDGSAAPCGGPERPIAAAPGEELLRRKHVGLEVLAGEPCAAACADTPAAISTAGAAAALRPAMPCHRRTMAEHPCYGHADAYHRCARLHLPVAPRCNLSCRYCVRDFDCVNESRPGVCSRLLTPAEALRRTERVVAEHRDIAVVGIAGPGDALENEETFETLRLVHGRFPELLICLSTNGLLLPERLDDLRAVGVDAVTVTINAVTPATAARIYAHVIHGGRRHQGPAAMSLLLRNQLEGVRGAVRSGMAVKVNSVFIPSLNDGEIPEIASTVAALGATVLNVIPVIPLGELASCAPPSGEALRAVQAACAKSIPVFTNCRRCRADAVGLLGKGRDYAVAG